MKSIKFSKLAWLGLGLVLSFPITGIILFAVVATLFGEGVLENTNGEMTTLGTLTTFLPVGIGICLIVLDLIFKPKLKSIWLPVSITGTILGFIGLFALTQDTGDGANIGAGFLLITGLVTAAIGIILKLSKR